MNSFATEAVSFLHNYKDAEVKAGQVWRIRRRPEGGEDLNPFNDFTVLGIEDSDRWIGDRLVKVARPYAYASCVGTVAPTVLLGAEVFEIPVKTLVSHYTMLVRDGHFRTR